MGIADVFPGATRSGKGHVAFCPAHSDERPSLSVSVKDGRALLKCHAGCLNKEIAKAAGFKSEAALYSAIEGRGHAGKRRRVVIKLAKRKAKKKAGTVDNANAILSHLVKSYLYDDERAEPLYYIDRFEWQGKKSFRPRLPDGRRTLDGVRRVVYRLSGLQGQPLVFLGEGEKVVEALEAHGLVATTTPNGASGWDPEFAKQLVDAGVKEVIGLPDKDAPGRKYIAAAAHDCTALGIKFRTLTLPDLDASEDAFDWFAKGHTRDELVELAQRAPVYEVQTISAGHLTDDYVYAVQTKRFIHVETLQMLDKEQFDALFATEFPLRGRAATASTEFLNDRAGRRVNAPTYRPGAGRLVREADRLCVNLYKPSALVPVEGDAGPWLRHLRYLVPDKKARLVVLKWCAFQVQHPDRKINWAIFIGGKPGIGKDAAFEPIRHALGDHNVGIVSPDDLTGGWSDFLRDKKLIIVEEFAVFEKKSLMNRLKPWLASPPTKLRINTKYVPQYDIPNLASFVFFSNDRNALTLEADDRRFFVYWSDVEPKDKAYYAEYYQWVEANAGVVLHYLQRIDLSKFNAAGRAPMTADKLQVIRDSQTPVEQFIRAQFDARQAPLDRDLVTVAEVLQAIPRYVGHASARSVAAVLKKLGAREMARQLRLADGTRPRVWAVRNVEAYERMSERELSAAYQARRSHAWPLAVQMKK